MKFKVLLRKRGGARAGARGGRRRARSGKHNDVGKLCIKYTVGSTARPRVRSILSVPRANETCFKNGLGEVQPGRWERVPKFDREGRPVEYLDTAAANAPPPEPRMRRAVAADAGKRRQEALAQAIRNAGIARPALQHGLRKKKRRRRAAVAARS